MSNQNLGLTPVVAQSPDGSGLSLCCNLSTMKSGFPNPNELGLETYAAIGFSLSYAKVLLITQPEVGHDFWNWGASVLHNIYMQLLWGLERS